MDDAVFTLRRGRDDVTVSGVTGAMFFHSQNPRTGEPQVFLLMHGDLPLLRQAIDAAEEANAAWRLRNGR